MSTIVHPGNVVNECLLSQICASLGLGQLHPDDLSAALVEAALQGQPFRIGGLQMALQYDMELWAWVTKGNNDCWPRTAIGGLPSKISARLIPIAPSGSLDLMRELDQNAPLEYGPDELRGRVPVLAAHLQHLMQSALDDLYHKEKARDV